LTVVSGPREGATAAVEAAVVKGDIVYASHAWSPFTQEGTKTMAYELWEQLGRRAPSCLVAPIGQGSLFLGAYRGFKDLLEAGLIDELPRMIGVQSRACAPIVKAGKAGLGHHDIVRSRHSIAEGIAVPRPIHDRQILKAIYETRGDAIAVSDDEIRSAQHELANAGLYVEPTGAATAAALRKARLTGIVVVALTGTGLKTPTPTPARR